MLLDFEIRGDSPIGSLLRSRRCGASKTLGRGFAPIGRKEGDLARKLAPH